MLEFADSIAVSREQAQALHESRWSPVPLEHIKAVGIWVRYSKASFHFH